MSGDVQPRKRKDKKRKKEEEPVSSSPLHLFSKEASEDVNIHVHKEEGTGGGICAKIVFFILFSALIVLIGLIITEHRGLTDLDVAESESKYSQIFEGWVDNDKYDDRHTLDDHDNEHFDDEEHEQDGHTLDDHDNEHMDDEEASEQSKEEHTLDDHDNEHFDDDQSTPRSEENEDEDASQQEISQSREEHIKDFHINTRYRRQLSEEEEDDENVTESQEDDSSSIYKNNKVEKDDDENADSKYEDNTEEINANDSEIIYEQDEENSKMEEDDIVEDSVEILDTDDKHIDSSEENYLREDSQQAEENDVTEYTSKASNEELKTESDSEEGTDDGISDKTKAYNAFDTYNDDISQEEVKRNVLGETVLEREHKSTSEDKSERASGESGEDEEKKEFMNASKDDDETSSEKSEKEEKKTDLEFEQIEKKIREAKQEAEISQTDNSGGTDNPGGLSSMIIKAIIGAAIMAVGHFVLVKKWNSDSPDETNRRIEDVHIDLTRRNTLIPPPPLQEIEQDVEYNEEEYSDEERDAGSSEDLRAVTDIAKKKYEQLRSSYSRSISPESDTDKGKNDNESDEDLEMENIEDIEEEELDEEEEEIEDIQGDEIQEIQEDEEIEIDEEDYENEEDEDYEDEELMMKLEAKYGKLKLQPKTKDRTPSTELDESDSEKLSDDNNDYEFAGVTNKDDWPIRKELDEAQRNIPNNAANALKLFEKILEKYPSSPRGFYGLAQAFDALAETEKSNERLEDAILNYLKVSELRNVPDALYKAALERCIDRTRFRGNYGKAVLVHLKLINRFPDEPKYRDQLTITYLTIGKIEKARSVVEETLQKWPSNGCALVHYGFIWKTADNNLEKGAYYMQKGIDTKDPCVIDGRFYFHLGDSYSRLGDQKKALKIYEDGVKNKLFLSHYQRSLYNVPRLTPRPWWHNEQLPRYQILFDDLEKHWVAIRNEGLAVLNQGGYFQDESENLKDSGDWKQFELFARGRRNVKNCNKTPFTCKLLASHPDARGCRRGQTKFSVMHPGTHVWAHCGPTNCRLRIHLGLKVPPSTYIRVGGDTRSWKEGKLLIFDDSFEHEVWHNGTEIRLVLIVDVWHPELTMTEKETLSSL